MLPNAESAPVVTSLPSRMALRSPDSSSTWKPYLVTSETSPSSDNRSGGDAFKEVAEETAAQSDIGTVHVDFPTAGSVRTQFAIERDQVGIANSQRAAIAIGNPCVASGADHQLAIGGEADRVNVLAVARESHVGTVQHHLERTGGVFTERRGREADDVGVFDAADSVDIPRTLQAEQDRAERIGGVFDMNGIDIGTAQSDVGTVKVLGPLLGCRVVSQDVFVGIANAVHAARVGGAEIESRITGQ